MTATPRRRDADTPGRLSTGSTATWHLPRKLAWHDMRRNKKRSVLAIVFVMVPLTALCVMVGFLSLSTPPRDEGVRSHGTASAVVIWEPGSLTYHADSDPTPRTPVPGTDVEASLGQNLAALQDFTGLELAAISLSQITTRGQVFNAVQTTPNPRVEPKVALAEGRWPRNETEVLVTPAGTAAGLPTSGTFTGTHDPGPNGQGTTTVTYTVVGRGDALISDRHPSYLGGGDAAHLVMGWDLNAPYPAPGTSPRYRFFAPSDADVDRATMTWYTDGWDIQSDFSVMDANGWQPVVERFFLVEAAGLVVFGLPGFLALALLLASTFTASRDAMRRDLVTLRINGSDEGVMKRVLGVQALTTAGIASVVALTIATITYTTLWFATPGSRLTAGDMTFVPPGGPWLVLVAFTVVACQFAVFLATRRSLSPRADMTWPRASGASRLSTGRVVAALALYLAGTGLVYLAAYDRQVEFAVIASTVPVLAVAWIVWLLCPHLHVLRAVLPRSMHFALRDGARNPGRVTPVATAAAALAMALVMGGVVMLTYGQVLNHSYGDAAQRGEALVQRYQGGNSLAPDRDDLAEAIRASLTGAQLTPLEYAGTLRVQMTAASRQEPVDTTWIVPTDCLGPTSFGTSAITSGDLCVDGVGGVQGSAAGRVLVLPAAEIIRRLALNEDQAQQVRQGAVVTANENLAGGSGLSALPLRLEPTDSYSAQATVTGDAQALPVVTIPDHAVHRGRFLQASGFVAAESTRGWNNSTAGFLVRQRFGQIDSNEASAMQEEANRRGLDVSVVANSAPNMRYLTYGSLITVIVVALIAAMTGAMNAGAMRSTARTLQMLGAGRGQIRGAVAAQSTILVGFGAVVGTAAAIVVAVPTVWLSNVHAPLPGVADAPFATTVPGPLELHVPWLLVALFIVGVPAITYAAANLFVPWSRRLTRRET